MDYISCVLSSNFLGYDVMGYISHTDVLSSSMIGFLPYHENIVEVLSNPLWILNLWTSADVSASNHHLFACWLLSRRHAITILCMLLLCLLLFLLRQDESPPLVSMENFNSSTNKFVTSVEFDKAPSSPTLKCLHGCFPYCIQTIPCPHHMLHPKNTE